MAIRSRVRDSYFIYKRGVVEEKGSEEDYVKRDVGIFFILELQDVEFNLNILPPF